MSDEPEFDLFAPYTDKHAELLRWAHSEGLVTFSQDGAAESSGKGFWVAIDKLEGFIDHVLKHGQAEIGTVNPDKPYVGKVFRLARHKQMPVRANNTRGYIQYVDSNQLFPEHCMILDEHRELMCILSNTNQKYWIKRFYFGKSVAK